MLSRTYETNPEREPYGDSGTPPLTSTDSELDNHVVPNWIGLVVVGFLLMIIGLSMAPASSSFGGGVMFIGLLMILGARFAKKWEDDGSLLADIDSTSSQELDEIADEGVDYDYWEMQQRRQQDIQEIVKAVKSTIRIRCRYCGTLNEEKANKCESCGANL
jgi:hypothetical protein